MSMTSMACGCPFIAVIDLGEEHRTQVIESPAPRALCRIPRQGLMEDTATEQRGGASLGLCLAPKLCRFLGFVTLGLAVLWLEWAAMTP